MQCYWVPATDPQITQITQITRITRIRRIDITFRSCSCCEESHWSSPSQLLMHVALSAQATPHNTGSRVSKTPAEVGMDAAKLNAAIEFATARETNQKTFPRDLRQEIIFGSLLGPIPKSRATTNGVRSATGMSWPSMVMSMPRIRRTRLPRACCRLSPASRSVTASSKISTRVGSQIKDGGYAGPHNEKVTWRHHLQQESEWEGEMWGKKHDFVGTVAFGEGERKPRVLQAPGEFYQYNDVRINRFSLSLLRLGEAGSRCVPR